MWLALSCLPCNPSQWREWPAHAGRDYFLEIPCKVRTQYWLTGKKYSSSALSLFCSKTILLLRVWFVVRLYLRWVNTGFCFTFMYEEIKIVLANSPPIVKKRLSIFFKIHSRYNRPKWSGSQCNKNQCTTCVQVRIVAWLPLTSLLPQWSSAYWDAHRCCARCLPGKWAPFRGWTLWPQLTFFLFT